MFAQKNKSVVAQPTGKLEMGQGTAGKATTAVQGSLVRPLPPHHGRINLQASAARSIPVMSEAHLRHPFALRTARITSHPGAMIGQRGKQDNSRGAAQPVTA